VTNFLKAGIEESFPRQRFETKASVARQRLGEPLIATTKEPNCSTRCFLFSRRRNVVRGLLVDFRGVRKKYADQNRYTYRYRSDTGRQIK
jgi:hypothetical protein